MSNLKYTNLPAEALDSDDLAQLALDMRWSWNHATDQLWMQLDPELWDLTHNPWVILQTVSQEKLETITSAPAFREKLKELTEARKANAARPRWFQQTYPSPVLKTVAYFCMEYMLAEALPIYSGGLGNVAGDQLKAAEDLGVPIIAVGLLYQLGYFRQEFDAKGNQLALYPFNDPHQLPIKPVRSPKGDWLRLRISLPGFQLWIRTWEVQVGQSKLYLLDTNDPANLPEYRGITSELYGGGPDLRLKQELVLGIAGWRLLRALGIRVDVCHLNEGHAAFAVLERAINCMEDTGHSFWHALNVTRAGNLFTTHTPVEAGFDRFSPDLMRSHFVHYAEDRLHISFDDLMSLGRANAGDSLEPFNMAYLAMRGCGSVNGVSQLHGVVSRRIFQGLFPRWPLEEIPVRHVTNGVHVPSWDSAEADRLWTDVCGKGCWGSNLENMGDTIRRASDEAIWGMRVESSKAVIAYIRRRYSRQVAAQGGSSSEVAQAGEVLNIDTLTLGFARRFATYKRPTLLLHDPDRLLRILTNQQRPVQLVLAGKAHPQDSAGQAMIRQWHEFIRRLGPRPPVIFLSDYDMLLTEQLVVGADVWLNTPRRPWEASGTSGMKVLVNGGLNLSELDGWWPEAYSREVGWAIGDGNEHGDDPAWDAAEANTLYGLLENEVVPQFYERDAAGIPRSWVMRMRDSMARLTPRFSANRVVREYTERHYLSSAVEYEKRAEDGGKLGADISSWKDKIASHWHEVRFGSVRVDSRDSQLHFNVVVYLGSLDPGAVHVELFANGQKGGEPFKQLMNPGPAFADGGLPYTASVATNRNPIDFTPRLVPYHPAASVPLEANQILWQK